MQAAFLAGEDRTARGSNQGGIRKIERETEERSRQDQEGGGGRSRDENGSGDRLFLILRMERNVNQGKKGHWFQGRSELGERRL